MQIMTDIPGCMSIWQIQQATAQDKHLQWLKSLIIKSWPDTKDHLHQDIRPYWSFKDDLAVIDGVIMKGRCIIIPEALKQQALDQLQGNHKGIEKTKLLAHKSIYWVNANNDIENYTKNCNICLEFQQSQPKEKIIHHDIPIRPWNVVGDDMFQLNTKNYLCIVDYHRKFPVVKKMEGLSTDSLISALKVVFAKYNIPKRVMSDTSGNFISEKFKNFCNALNIEQTMSS